MSPSDREMLSRLIRENIHKHVTWYSMSIVAMITVSLMTSCSAWIMRDVMNAMVASTDIFHVIVVSSTVAGIFIVKGIASFVQNYYLSCAGNSIIAEQQRKIYRRLLQYGMEFYDSNQSSELQVRFTHATQSVRSVVDIFITSFLRDFLTLVGLIVVMFLQEPTLSLCTIIIGPLCILGVRILVKRVRHIMEQGMVAIGHIIQNLQETVIGIRIVKSFAMEEVMNQRMCNMIKEVEDRLNKVAKIESATSPIMETISGLSIAGIILFSGFLMSKKGTSNAGEIMSFITALLMAYEPAKRIARTRIILEGGMVGVRCMFSLLDHPIMIEESPHAVNLPVGKGTTVFRDVFFSYKQGHPVLSGINLCFKSGKMTALVGPSGSGKSTIINLLMRMYDPSSGSIEIDGINIRDITFSSLRERISYVGQDVFLFSNTVRYNILIGRPMATEEEMIEIAKSANAHDFIMSLPQGYDTYVGENGSNLSGGQKQRIAIARAMLRDGHILVLDEATSALDTHTENLVRQALSRLMQGRTTIVIAHRISTIIEADHIIFIEDGKVSESGDQKYLLQQKDGSLYKKMYASQLLENLS
ncbi:putative multidrug export ATP-binding/permease protein [Candidatus Liberibacter asiaticus]|nr:putative multidrug export ATP-binding/permease protein [Candidatus Liberibacter asiaticus]BAP26680.1 ABC transporter nucleotide binding/ATPase [Candidatus Liberibacter asiaticus str. Ishi-1]KAE9510672.1 putative multidrug export ATP-binding/permease protein [Candidatus Liberibacter asiaticus]KAE9512031.1 putative multidrug export ATP-binding/permease protein [Candidatus Liberibacter asiaticus]KAE9513100.1 putative multidrug export ATP-binding/permease protein [Candidatus Liberibacter asiatic